MIEKVFLRHARRCNSGKEMNCSKGLRRYMKVIGFDYFIFLTQGIPFSYLEKHGGSVGEQAIEIAKTEAQNGIV